MASCEFIRSTGDEAVFLNPKLVVAVHSIDQSGRASVMQVANRYGGSLVVNVRDEIGCLRLAKVGGRRPLPELRVLCL